jgi:hypothetical protein
MAGMSGTDPATLKMTIRVGKRYRATLTVDRASCVIALACDWQPTIPDHLSRSELADYRRGRAAFLKEFATLIGGNILVAETGTGALQIFEPNATEKT